jgi:hypothetical protein
MSRLTPLALALALPPQPRQATPQLVELRNARGVTLEMRLLGRGGLSRWSGPELPLSASLCLA